MTPERRNPGFEPVAKVLAEICRTEFSPAFDAKIKTYHNLGFPEGCGRSPGPNGGRGTARRYSIEQAFALAVALTGGAPPSYTIKDIGPRIPAMLRAAANGKAYVYRPLSALAGLTSNPNRRASGTMVVFGNNILRKLEESGLWPVS